MRKLILFLSLIAFSLQTKAQLTSSDTSVLINPHSANKAANMSALLPGLGQVYNRQYLKVPVLYAGAAGLVYGIVWNNRNYQKYLSAYKLDSDTSSSTASEFNGVYSVANLITLKDYYRRNRDLSAIVLVLLYAANIVDAYVYAQFYNFDVSDNLSMNIKPFVIPPTYQGTRYLPTTTGLTLTFRLK